jgi:magnesium-transporting ATPase (P-type)
VKYDIGKDLRHFVDEKEKELFGLRYEYQYERPNPFIYSFTGSYNSIPIDNNNIILRGCMVKITRWVTGVVIYTGVDSKIMLNSNKSRQKKSRL